MGADVSGAAQISAMIRKDLTRRLRAPVWLIVSLLFPLTFAGMLGLAVGRRGGSELPRIQVLLLDLDQSGLSRALGGAGEADDSPVRFSFIPVTTEEEGRRRMEDGEASGFIVIPKGFAEQLFDGKQVTLRVYKNPAEQILPQVVEELAHVAALYLDQGAYILGEPIAALSDSLEGVEDDVTTFPTNAVLATLSANLADRVRPALHYVFPPAIVYGAVTENNVPLDIVLKADAGTTLGQVKEQAAAVRPQGEEPGSSGGFNFFALLLPMVSVVSMLFLGEGGMRDLLEEQQAGTLRRQLASPAGVRRVLAAKIIFTIVLASAAMVLLMVVGMLLGWIPVGTSPLGLAALIPAIAFGATGLATLVYGFLRTDRAASAAYSAIVMTMSFLGGSFIPMSQMPAAMRSMARGTVNFWGIQGLTDLVQGGGVATIVNEAGILLAIGAIGCAIGSVALSRRLAAGGA